MVHKLLINKAGYFWGGYVKGGVGWPVTILFMEISLNKLFVAFFPIGPAPSSTIAIRFNLLQMLALLLIPCRSLVKLPLEVLQALIKLQVIFHLLLPRADHRGPSCLLKATWRSWSELAGMVDPTKQAIVVVHHHLSVGRNCSRGINDP